MIKDSTSSNRSASDVALLTFGGRLLAFVGRTMYIARFGAANALLNAFTYALHVPNVLFNIVGTALNTVMIPVYNALLAEEKTDEAKQFIDNIISIALVLLGFLTAAGIAGAPLISRIVGGANFEDTSFFIFALRFLMPVMLFFGFGAIFAGLLQSHGVFRLPALVSAPGGIILIAYLLFFGDRFGVTGLIFVTLLGVAMQPLLLLPAIRKLGYRFRFSFDLKNKNIRAAGKLSLPVLITVASYQAHFLFAHAMAFRLGTAAIMDYAQQMVQVFILIIVLSVTAVYFPKLSALWAKGDKGGYNQNLKNALLYTIFWVLPAALGLILLRFEIMDFLINWRGQGEPLVAGNMMGLYAVGIIAIAVKEIADRGFYAVQDSKTPAVFAVIKMTVNIGATLILLPHLGTYAMPVAYGIAAFTGVGGLLTRLQMKTRFLTKAFALELVKTIIAVLLMAGAVLAVRHFNPFEGRLLGMLAPAGAGAAIYFGAAYVLRATAARSIVK